MSSLSRPSLVLALLGALVSLPGCADGEGEAPAAPKEQVKTKGEEAVPALPAAPAACNADASWLTSTTPPTEIGGGVPIADETNCQFQQFAWQWFLSLVQPSPTAQGELVFETLPVYQPKQKNQCSTKARTGRAEGAKALFLRTSKVADDSVEAVLPVELLQATSQVLYDQTGTIVLYNVHYSPNECEATSAGFLPNTTEIKTSWRVLKAPDPSYYTMTADIGGLGPQTLGLVGFHLVINTKNHPEFVWATFEHESNAPRCTSPQAAPASGWAFTSAEAAACLVTGTVESCSQFSFNSTFEVKSGTRVPPTGAPNNVCGVYPDGTDTGSATGGNNNDTNRFNIDTLNTQLVGPSGLLAQLPADNPMSVWQNYYLGGSLWTNGGVASTEATPGSVQRGSLELANLTMETFFQSPNRNCFTCHTYDPTNPLAVSHIADDLLPETTAAK